MSHPDTAVQSSSTSKAGPLKHHPSSQANLSLANGPMSAYMGTALVNSTSTREAALAPGIAEDIPPVLVRLRRQLAKIRKNRVFQLLLFGGVIAVFEVLLSIIFKVPFAPSSLTPPAQFILIVPSFLCSEQSKKSDSCKAYLYFID